MTNVQKSEPSAADMTTPGTRHKAPDAVGALVHAFFNSHPEEARQMVEALPTDELAGVVRNVELTALLPLFDRLTPSRGLEIFERLPLADQLSALTLATPRMAVLLLSGMSQEKRDGLLGQLTAESSAELTRILNFPDDTAARLMDRATDTLQPAMTVGQARERLRSAHIKRARSLYVVDGVGELVGRVDVQDLATHFEDDPLTQLINTVDGWAPMTATRQELVDLFEELGLDSIPVLDNEHRLIGVVRYASLILAATSVASADLQKMMGASGDERALSSPFFAVKRRLGWLHINLLTAFLAASVVGLFESIIAQFTALAILLPVVAGQSGNAGSQALAVTMRGLALREVGLRQWRNVMTKETIVGLINGVALAITCGLGVYVWSQSIGIGVVIAVAMVLSMIAAGIAGAAVPMILVRLRQDPATASSIILTTVTDVAGFFAFLGTATLLAFML